MTATATLGFAVSTWAWVVTGTLGQQMAREYGLGPAGAVLLLALPVVVGSAAQIPAGALTDRYGARFVLPAVSAIAAVSTLLAAFGTTGTNLAAIAVATCVAGTAFSVGASLVARCERGGRRGLGLSVFGVGVGGAAVAALMVRPMTAAMTLHGVAALCAAVLASYAILAAVALRDSPAPAHHASLPEDIVAVLRMPAGRQWCVLYAVASAPIFALVFYLPTYAPEAYNRPWGNGAVATAVLLVVAAAARPVGGRLAEGGKAPPVLVTCYASAAGLGLVVALEPSSQVVSACLVLIAAAAGTASGALLCRIGRAVPPERAGLIAGVVGAVAGLGGLLPPALLHAAHAAQGQYTVGIMVLSAVSLACATYVRRRHDWINPLAFPLLHSTPRALAPSEFQANATTVVALAASDTVADQAVVLAILSELATRQELIIVYGLDAQPSSDTLTPTQLVAAIRDRLPRHEIAAVLVDAAGRTDSCDWALLADLVADGAIAVAVAEGPDLAAATQVAVRRLNADTVWALSRNPAGEVGLHPPATASVDALAAQPRTPSR